MAVVSHLLTSVDLGAYDPGPDSRSMSVEAVHEAVLSDGRHILLLNDRGWSGTVGTAWLEEPSAQERERARHESPSAWAHATIDDLKETARMVVGPDAAFGDFTQAEMERGHWDWLANRLREHGVEVTGDELRTLPHEVQLSDDVLRRVGR